MSKYSDKSDFATELEQRERDIALAEHRRRAEAERLLPNGECHNCGGEVEGERLFCDRDCASDHEFRLKMEKHR